MSSARDRDADPGASPTPHVTDSARDRDADPGASPTPHVTDSARDRDADLGAPRAPHASDVSTRLVDGRALARAIEAEVARDVAELSKEGPVRLVAVSVGDAGASDVYLASQSKACQRVGVRYRNDRLAPGATQEGLAIHLRALAGDPRVTGIILQLPLPDGFDARRAQAQLEPRKDVEGVHPENLGRTAGGRGTLVPCTAAAAVHILEAEGTALRGAEVVVVGHSEIVGKPTALLLLDRLATVTVCHVGTKDLAAHTRRADVVVVAVGKAGLVRGDMLKPGAVVVDVGINMVADGAGGSRVVGDVAPDAAGVAGLLTPVPGGVGPVTVAMLLRNTVRAARLQRGLEP
jgi:methylenetetrahydrofolate dehydrogenase (NADP+) / methenyltetrahydrofolate cyclohydrolase